MELSKQAKELYNVFDKYSPFDNPNGCKGCPILCARKRNVHWLLDCELQHLKKILPISKTKNSYFFEGGLCSQLGNGKCRIYENRPFECRLNPLSIYEINGELYWIVYNECPRIQKGGEEFIKKLSEFADRIEPHLNKKIKDNFKEISAAIKKFEPLVEGKEFRTLRKFYNKN